MTAILTKAEASELYTKLKRELQDRGEEPSLVNCLLRIKAHLRPCSEKDIENNGPYIRIPDHGWIQAKHGSSTGINKISTREDVEKVVSAAIKDIVAARPERGASFEEVCAYAAAVYTVDEKISSDKLPRMIEMSIAMMFTWDQLLKDGEGIRFRLTEGNPQPSTSGSAAQNDQVRSQPGDVLAYVGLTPTDGSRRPMSRSSSRSGKRAAVATPPVSKRSRRSLSRSGSSTRELADDDSSYSEDGVVRNSRKEAEKEMTIYWDDLAQNQKCPEQACPKDYQAGTVYLLQLHFDRYHKELNARLVLRCRACDEEIQHNSLTALKKHLSGDHPET